MPWSSTVVATDACRSGAAVATASLPSSIVASIGRTGERWRCRVPSAICARRSALGPTMDS
eukprot:3215425-Pyramimonas_sp.AAC.1